MADDGDDLRKGIRDSRTSVATQFDQHGQRLGSNEPDTMDVENLLAALDDTVG